ncbi:hypothetical protein AB0D09_40840 [Streptomyces sp. NPDC049097]|uniref:hypothetical protein n=1 Tax=unclassified Streptomyces TaxID=2593676 RepID=UPI003415BF5A
MKITGAVMAGSVFGSLTSLANAVSSPYGPIGARAAAGAGTVVSLLLDAGWSWAALAVVVGWAVATPARSALAGVAALTAATVSYYVMDAYVWDAGTDMVVWLVVGVPLGLVLGAVGALVRRPGLTGLFAALVVPVGAAVQMVVIPPGEGLIDARLATTAAGIVWAAAALSAAWALGRFWRWRRAAAAA